MLGRRDNVAGMPVMVTAAAGAVGLLLMSIAPGTRAGSSTSPGVTVAEMTTIPLSDDDGDHALFAANDFYPGKTVTNCIQVTASRQPITSEVRLSAADLTGALIPALRVEVEAGTGGRFGDCTGFTGTSVYTGPLDTLATGAEATPGVPLSWEPGDNAETRTFRITVGTTGDNAIQGATAQATLRWVRVMASSPTPSAPATTPPTSKPTPAPTASRTPTVSPTTPAPTRTTAPTPSRTTAKPSARATQPNATVSRSPHTSAAAAPTGSATRSVPPAAAVDANPTAGAWDKAATIAWNLLAEASKHPWFPLASALAMWLFLIIADRKDRRDPKLALAPMTRDAYYRFPDDTTSTHVVSNRPGKD